MKTTVLLASLSMICMLAMPVFAEDIDVFQHHGALSWYELTTTDVDAALKFYTQLFGWKTEEHPMEDGTRYVVINVGGKPVGGMMKIPPQAEGAPPYWGLYITVDDVDATAKQAKELGATIIVPPTEIPEAGRFCVLQDPQGAVISIISYPQQTQ